MAKGLLAVLETDPDAFARRYRAVLARVSTALGSNHPDSLVARVPLALVD